MRPDGDGIKEVVGDKGYHSNQSLVDLEAVGVRSYIAEPDRGRPTDDTDNTVLKRCDVRIAGSQNRTAIQ